MAIAKRGWIVPPYRKYPGLDAVGLGYRLFGKPKESRRGNHCAIVNDAKRGVQTGIWQTPAAFFERGIMNLVWHVSKVHC